MNNELNQQIEMKCMNQTVELGLQSIDRAVSKLKIRRKQIKKAQSSCCQRQQSRMPLSSKSLQSLKQPSHRINFRVIACTSCDSNYSAAQLQLQSPQSKGWASQRFCTYPQVITIQLIDLAIVQKLTFLSHQSKITTKIDIECKETQGQMWKKLGYTCMESNMTTNYQARQLRTVKLNKQLVKFFRFTLAPNYVNTINVFNQVSLIAISLYGERYHPKPLDDMKQRGILPPGAVLDKQTLDKLRQLEYMKREAIDQNDFEKASQIKQEIDKLKSGVEALAILERQKKDAIRKEDYEEAKRIYEKMKKIRGPIPRVVVSSNDRYDHDNRSMIDQQRASFTPIVSSIKNTKKKLKKSLAFDEDSPNKNKDSPIQQLKKSILLPQVTNSKVINFDEIRVGPKTDRNIYQEEAYLYEQGMKYNESIEKSPKGKFNRNRLSLDQKQVYRNNGNNKRAQKKQEEYQQNEKPTSLPPQCQQYFPVIQQSIFHNIFSNDKNLRQHALDSVSNLVDKIQQQPLLQKLFINAVIFIVKHVINDRIVSILLKAVDLLGMMFKEYKPKVEEIERENMRNIKFILEKMSEYIGHASDKLKNQVQDVYVVLPKYSKSTSKQLCIQIITLNEKIDRAPRSIIAKLEMLGKLIRKYDHHSIKQNNSSQNYNDKKKQKYEDVIEYAKRFLEDRNNQVRTTAAKLLVYLGKVIGVQEVMGQLEDVREVTRKVIEDRLIGKNDVEEQRKVMPRNNDSPKNIAKDNSPRLKSPKKSPPRKDTKKVQSPQLPKSKSPPPVVKKPSQQQKLLQSPKNQNSPSHQVPNPQYICQYCQQQDKRLQNQTFRDIHLFKSCPLIAICKECSQCIEVELLNQHMVQECEKKKFWKKCPRCKEAVLGKLFNQHVEQKRCIAAKPLNVANRCPHCHQDIEPKKRGWIKHLVEEGCPCQKDRQK